ncbi:MAG: TonB-dependent hemoglobin/transferrin/lactoferrin family receptor [Burkholderiaceae bacterium]|nr:TonB-dependent hemoglobin/transferrin/lactoferrin family receptor [Burkholderiaceae bacterium]
MKKTKSPRCLCFAWRPLAAAVAAATGAAAAQTVTPEITVTATRVERPADEVPAAVTVRDRGELDARFVEDIRDLAREEPGVSVRRAPARFGLALASTGRAGNEGFNIRGIEGNRVLILVDGVRVPNAFSFGANSFGRGDYFDLSLASRVEILRGPASALYGSDGLAGAVSFTTPDPADLLARSRGDRHLGWRVAYDSADEGFANTLSAAARAGSVEAMLMATYRRGHEVDNQGTNDAPNATRTRPNPQDLASFAALSKFVWNVAPGNRLRLTVEGLRSKLDTDGLSAVAVPPLTATSTLALTAEDTIRRSRASVDQRVERLTWGLADSARWAVYAQQARDRQWAFEDRNTAADRIRDTRYEETGYGATVELDKRFALVLPQRLVYGLDLARTRYDNLRDGTVPPVGETFPTKAFPATDYTLLGVFAQDELLLADGRFALIPALRYDRFSLKPRRDALFPGSAVSLSDGALSPKLALQWLPQEGVNVYLYAARGFRAPTADQVNNGFTNPVSNYASIGNPDLRPETSRTVEIGAKLRGERGRLTVAAFAGRYEDFIEQVRVRGSFTPADPAIFQYVNLRDVRIEGAELLGEWNLLPGWTVKGSAAWAQGEDRASGAPLNSINPLQLSAGVAWRALPSLRATLDVRHAARKRAGDVDNSSFTAPATQFIPPAWTVVDLALGWQPLAWLSVHAGVFNLTDRKYWVWTDVRGLASNSAVADAFTQPGRTYAVNVSAVF